VGRATRRSGVQIGTVDSLEDDLSIINSAGGLEQASADDLAGILTVMGIESASATDQQLDQARLIYRKAVETATKRILSQSTQKPSWTAGATAVESFVLGEGLSGTSMLDVRSLLGNPDTVRKYEKRVLKRAAQLSWTLVRIDTISRKDVETLKRVVNEMDFGIAQTRATLKRMEESDERLGAEWLIHSLYSSMLALQAYDRYRAHLVTLQSELSSQMEGLTDHFAGTGQLDNQFRYPVFYRFAVLMRTRHHESADELLELMAPAEIYALLRHWEHYLSSEHRPWDKVGPDPEGRSTQTWLYDVFADLSEVVGPYVARLNSLLEEMNSSGKMVELDGEVSTEQRA